MAPLLMQLWRRHQGNRGERLTVLASLLGLPGKLVVPYSMLVVPTLTGATQLLALGATSGLGWFCAAVCCSGVALVVMLTTTSFRSVGRHWFRQHFLPQVEWVDRSRRRGGAGFVARWGPLFDSYVSRSPWFQAVELVTAMVTAVLTGLVPLDGDASMCGNLQIASCFVSLAFLAAVVGRRPHSAPVDLLLAVLNAGLTALSAVLGLVDVDTTDLSNAQIGLNFVGTAAFLMSLVLEGNVDRRLRDHVRDLLEASGRHRSAASECTVVASKTNWLVQHALAEESSCLSESEQLAMLEEIIKMICDERGDDGK